MKPSSGRHYTREEFFLYYLEELAPEDTAALEAHLAGCAQCLERARCADPNSRYAAGVDFADLSPAYAQSLAAQSAPPQRAASIWRSGLSRLSRLRAWLTPERLVLATTAAGLAVLGFLFWETQGQLRRAHEEIALLEKSRREDSGPLLALIRDTGGLVTMTASGQIRLPGAALPDDWPGRVKQLLERGAVKQFAGLPAMLAQVRTGQLERGVPDHPRDKPTLLSPFATAVKTTRPTFRWTPVQGASSYRVFVATTSPELVCKGVVDGTVWTLAPAADCRDLEPGKVYLWYVETTVKGLVKVSGNDRFLVLDAARLQEVAHLEKQFAGSALALTALYESEGLYEDAEAQIRRLSELSGGPAPPEVMRASVEKLRKQAGGTSR
jgi:hypothetical protein